MRDVSVGEGKENSMHTVVGGPVDGVPLVCLPGYGAGSGFYFRNIGALSKQFRLHLVDLLGTGMSGRAATFRVPETYRKHLMISCKVRQSLL